MKTLSNNALIKLIQLIKNNVYNSTNTELLEVDNVVTENSNNLITSGAVFSVIGDINDALEAML